MRAFSFKLPASHKTLLAICLLDLTSAVKHPNTQIVHPVPLACQVRAAQQRLIHHWIKAAHRERGGGDPETSDEWEDGDFDDDDLDVYKGPKDAQEQDDHVGVGHDGVEDKDLNEDHGGDKGDGASEGLAQVVSFWGRWAGKARAGLVRVMSRAGRAGEAA